MTGDGLVRCAWGTSDAMREYHDREWGRPVTGEAGLFERLCLEAFQSGLSWSTILAKREAFRRAFAGFDPEAVARFGARDVERLLGDASIVRNRRQDRGRDRERRRRGRPAGRRASLSRAGVVVRARRCFGAAGGRRHPGGDPESQALAKALKRQRRPVRRADDRVRADAGLRARERPRRRLSRAGEVESERAAAREHLDPREAGTTPRAIRRIRDRHVARTSIA